MATDLAYFEFYPANSRREWNGQHFFLRVLFGDGELKTSGGGGGWEEKHRPYLPPLTVWKGPTESYTHKIPVMLDAYGKWDDTQKGGPTSSVIQRQKWEIEKLAGVLVHLKKGSLPEPPELILDAAGTIPHDETSEPGKHTWIISEPPEWGETIRNEQGVLVRQAGVLTFKIFESDISLERSAPAKQPYYRLHADGKKTFEEIAKGERSWGPKRASFGTKLARLNHAHNARHVPKRGTITGPSPKQLEEWKRGK